MSARSVSDSDVLREELLLLFEDQLAPGRAHTRHQHEPGNLLLAGRREHRHRRTLAIAGDEDAFRVDVLALAQPLDRGDGVVGVIVERDALGSPAALADAALVVAQDDEIAFRQLPGQLREQRNAGHRGVAVDRTGPGHQHDGGMPQPALSRRRRQRARQAEPGGRNDDLGVGRVAERLLARFDAREILAGDQHAGPRDFGLGEAAAVVDRHFGIEGPVGILERQRETPGLQRAGRRS